jgi:MSHA biogenesis protein MshM
MYQTHFGLSEPPFGLTPNTSFAYTSSSFEKALNTLVLAVTHGEGFIKITGEVGTGKSLLCRTFLASLGERFASAYIVDPSLKPRALLRAIAHELGVTISAGDDQHDFMNKFTEALLTLAAAGKSVVICLDEAQAMPLESLEALRLLTNVETEKRKLLQVVLFGQPELDDNLAQKSVRQLRQRITFQHRLEALGRAELEHYLAHRLRVAGYRGRDLFTTSAVRKLHRASGGVPRLVNVMAHKALLLAFGEGLREVRPSHVRAAIHDTPAARTLSRWPWLRLAVLVVSVAGTGALAALDAARFIP